MKNSILIFITKINFLFPYYIGFRFIKYTQFLKRNRRCYDNGKAVVTITNHAINEIPFYNKAFKRMQLKSVEDFKRAIPLIDKDVVMANWNYFQMTIKSKNKTISGTTGGTSGKPLKLILPKNRYVFELATMYSMWKNVGWSGQIRAVIRNNKLKNNQNFKVNPLKKEIIFDGFNTSPIYYEIIYSVIKKYSIRYIHAYPSSAYQFSQYLLQEKKDVSFIAAFLCGSEALLPEQKHLISDQLGIKIYHWYGHSEKLILGGFCKNSDLIHIEPTYGYFELLDKKGDAITQIGEVGEIIGTTLHNSYMPLIRYKTGDYAEYAGNYCEYCGRHLPLLKKVYGRWDKNKIFKKNGSYISTTALNLHGSMYDKILGLQYAQNKKGELIVNIIKSKSFTDSDHTQLDNHFKTAFGAENTVKVVYVKTIEKLPNGKFVNLISELN